MKHRTRELATKWLETAKKSDTFTINTVPHSKKEIEDLLGGKHVEKHAEQINTDIEEHSHEDMEGSLHGGDTQEHDGGDSEG